MSEPEKPPSRFEVSHDGGRTWQPMPRGWQQSGRIDAGPGDNAIQDVGRGREIWYRVVDPEGPVR